MNEAENEYNIHAERKKIWKMENCFSEKYEMAKSREWN